MCEPSFSLAATIICNRETGQSRGFGFVTFAHSEHAVNAKDEMNNSVREKYNHIPVHKKLKQEKNTNTKSLSTNTSSFGVIGN